MPNLNNLNYAISVEETWKAYRLGKVGIQSFKSDTLFFIRKLLGKTQAYHEFVTENDRTKSAGNSDHGKKTSSRPQPNQTNDYVWALRDINIKIKSGEVVGIIGRNGAGKSTLLKLLSRVTAPTLGKIRLRGRLASLLEVGTGFHPDLTGRENIFLNGTILGLKHREIRNKLEEIIDFSGCQRYIDTPVKRYSSGMYVRLAFAVAAHLEPEILIIDEVLAVGDMDFQKKCMKKIEDVAGNGRTIIFVSHNMAAVTRLCPRVILLDKGSVLLDGPGHEVTSKYLTLDRESVAEAKWGDGKLGNEIVEILNARVVNSQGKTTENFAITEPIGIEVVFKVKEGNTVLIPNFPVHNDEGVYAFHLSDSSPEWLRTPRPKGTYKTTAWIPANLLAEGALTAGVAISTINPLQVHAFAPEVIRFCVYDNGNAPSVRGDYIGEYPGVVRPMVQWSNTLLANG